MKIPIATLLNRAKELERTLDLHIAELCSKASPLFTRVYIIPKRSPTAYRSFARLIEQGVVKEEGKKTVGPYQVTQYSFNRSKYLELYDSPTRQSCPSRTQPPK